VVHQAAISGLVVLLVCASGWCGQDAAQLSAKTLYYQGEADEQKPPVKTAPKHVSKASTPSNVKAVSATVEHLGLRYNLLLFDRSTNKSVAVDPDHVFEQGDCVQLQFAPNRSGYLYVFDKGSSGKWEVLLPSTLMSDEMNVMQSGQVAKVPQNYCFTVQNPAGTEHLFVVLSRSQEDMYSLDRAIRSGGAKPAPDATPVTEAANRLEIEIQQMRTGLGSRDLGVEKINEPTQGDEPVHSVYVVNTSTRSSDRLVTEIQIRHQ
jgi:hypothetical protein